MTADQRNSLFYLASVPSIFGFHQITEGFVWLDPTNTMAVRTFAYIAYCFWPTFTPFAVYYMEKSRNFCKTEADSLQMKRISFITNMAIPVGTLLFLCVLAEEPLQVSMENGHVRYLTCQTWIPDPIIQAFRVWYGVTAISGLFYSSVKYASLFGMTTGFAFMLSIVLYEAEFESTWCYFSAVLSVVVVVSVWAELESYPPLKKL